MTYFATPDQRARRSVLYYGMKAVQLTEMSNRVGNARREYNLILTERTTGGELKADLKVRLYD